MTLSGQTNMLMNVITAGRLDYLIECVTIWWLLFYFQWACFKLKYTPIYEVPKYWKTFLHDDDDIDFLLTGEKVLIFLNIDFRGLYGEVFLF